jgi:hypothetical protein
MLNLILFVLAFLLVAHPATYRTTRSVLGSWVATQDGLAKLGGLVLHALVLIGVLILLNRLRKTSGYAHWGEMDTHAFVGGHDMNTKAQEVPHTLEPANIDRSGY